MYYNTAAVIDADGTLPRQVPQARTSRRSKGFWEKFYFRPGQPRLPGLRHRGRQGRRLHLLRPPLPRGLAGARPQRRRDRVQPVSATQPRPVRVPLASSSSRPRRSPTSTTSARSTGSASRPLGDNDFYGQSYFVDPRGQVRRRRRRRAQAGADRPRPRPGHDPARSATLGSSTATAAPTPTTTIVASRREIRMARTLITGGTVVIADRARRRPTS